MKKALFIILAFGIMLGMSNCDNEPEEANPFVGAWEAESGYRIVFTKTTITDYKSNGDLFYEGTYTYNDTHITVTINTATADTEVLESWGDTKTAQYRFVDDKLYYGGWWERIN